MWQREKQQGNENSQMNASGKKTMQWKNYCWKWQKSGWIISPNRVWKNFLEGRLWQIQYCINTEVEIKKFEEGIWKELNVPLLWRTRQIAQKFKKKIIWQQLGLGIQTVGNNYVPSQNEMENKKLNTSGLALQFKYIWQLWDWEGYLTACFHVAGSHELYTDGYIV